MRCVLPWWVGCTPMQDQIRRRDYEISRLGSRAGADVDALSLQARNEANESMILQLNSAVSVPDTPHPHTQYTCARMHIRTHTAVCVACRQVSAQPLASTPWPVHDLCHVNVSHGSMCTAWAAVSPPPPACS